MQVNTTHLKRYNICFIIYYLAGVESMEEDACPSLPTSAHTLVTTLQGVHTASSAPSGTALEVRCAAGYRDAHYPCETSTVSCVDGAWRGRVPNCGEYKAVRLRVERFCAIAGFK